MDQLLLPHGMTLTMLGGIGSVSDGYHTFNELYDHRCLLFCLALRDDPAGWKSRLHEDGTMYDGWFIAGTALICDAGEPNDTLLEPISYHLPLRFWDMCHAHERPTAPPFDGHTSFDVLDRLMRALKKTKV